MKVCTTFTVYLTVEIEDITWLSGDMKFLFECLKYFTSEHSERVKYFSTAIATVISSRVKITCFCAKAHLVFHWYLYNKKDYYVLTACRIALVGYKCKYFFFTKLVPGLVSKCLYVVCPNAFSFWGVTQNIIFGISLARTFSLLIFPSDITTGGPISNCEQ